MDIRGWYDIQMCKLDEECSNLAEWSAELNYTEKYWGENTKYYRRELERFNKAGREFERKSWLMMALDRMTFGFFKPS